MYVYIIWEEDTRFYKIGVAQNTKARLKALRCGNPHKLKLIRKIKVPSRKVAYDIEWEVKQKFGCYKVREYGEWYEMDFGQITALEKYIDKYLEKAA